MKLNVKMLKNHIKMGLKTNKKGINELISKEPSLKALQLKLISVITISI